VLLEASGILRRLAKLVTRFAVILARGIATRLSCSDAEVSIAVMGIWVSSGIWEACSQPHRRSKRLHSLPGGTL
jgi:hypothetical protein